MYVQKCVSRIYYAQFNLQHSCCCISLNSLTFPKTQIVKTYVCTSPITIWVWTMPRCFSSVFLSSSKCTSIWYWGLKRKLFQFWNCKVMLSSRIQIIYANYAINLEMGSRAWFIGWVWPEIAFIKQFFYLTLQLFWQSRVVTVSCKLTLYSEFMLKPHSIKG